MTIYVNMHEAKSRLSELVAAALQGEEVILQKAGVPQARIVPTNPVAPSKDEIIAKRKALFGSVPAVRAVNFGPGTKIVEDADLDGPWEPQL
jgi:prevent-host-death family protein